jgi:excisionase family DNA binding protein
MGRGLGGGFMPRKIARRTPKHTHTPKDAEILTPDAAAAVLGVSKRTLLHMAREGTVPGKKIGRQWRFHRSTLRRWVAGDSEAEALVAALNKAGVKNVTIK